MEDKIYMILYSKEDGVTKTHNFYNEETSKLDSIKTYIYKESYFIRDIKMIVPCLTSVFVYTKNPEVWECLMSSIFVDEQIKLKKEITDMIGGVNIEWK
ncbi:MAG: hypothetical protein ACRC45_00550 [Cetobacterium sp.]